LAVGFVFLFFFRGWGTLAAVISGATIISYLTGPVSAMTLRRTAPEIARPMRLPALGVLSCLGFVFSTELMYWATWPLCGEIVLLVVVGLPIYFYYQARGQWRDFRRQLNGAWWLIAYLPAIAGLSYIGSVKFHGLGWMTYGWDLVIVGLVGLAFYFWGLASGWRTPDVEAAGMPSR
jgi:amino acid transporter